MLTIARDGLTYEMMVPFVRRQLENQGIISSQSFGEFLKDDVQNKTVSFVADVTFEFMESLFMLRDGVRYHIPTCVFAGQAKLAKLWSGRNHPLYRELELSFNMTLTRMPNDIRYCISI